MIFNWNFFIKEKVEAIKVNTLIKSLFYNPDQDMPQKRTNNKLQEELLEILKMLTALINKIKQRI